MYFCVTEGRHHLYSTLQLTTSFSKKLLNQKKRNRNIQRKSRRLLLHMCSEQPKRGTVIVLVSSKSSKPGVNPYSFSQTLSLVYYGFQVISCDVCHLHLFLSHFHTLYQGLFLLPAFFKHQSYQTIFQYCIYSRFFCSLLNQN